MRKKFKIVFLILISVFLLIIFEYIFMKTDLIENVINIEKLSEEPIDLSTGIINNDYFGISSNGKNATETTEGINSAIEYAYKNSINYIKLDKGEYLIDGTYKKLVDEDAGISIKSNMTFDLNSSVIRQIANDSEHYVTISIYDAENVKIINGILIGDREEHEYIENSSSQWGMGISIRGGKNIEICNLEIREMIGDGIYITKLEDNQSQNLKIYNCNINDCRRQGISVISADTIDIYDNEIFNISGTNPQAAVDLEGNSDADLITNVKIYNNKMYSFGADYAIQSYKNAERVDIYDNEIYGKIRVNDIKDEMNIYNNVILDSEITAYLTQNNIDSGKYIKQLNIYNNSLVNSNIDIQRTQNVNIENNNIENGSISIQSSNAYIKNNSMKATEEKKYAYYFTVLNVDEGTKKFTIYCDFKEPEGSYNRIQLIKDTPDLQIIDIE